MTYDVQKIRDEFPILRTQVHGKPLVYLDNAATTQKPRAMIAAPTNYYATMNANIHRGVHYLAETATAAFESVREQVRAFVNARETCEIIFTRNTTEAINLVAQSYGRTHLQPGDEILLTEMEHHSNLIPWQLIATATGATLRFIPVTTSGILDCSTLDTLITPRTKIVACTLLSNVLGSTPPIARITKLAHARGAVVLLDAAQAVVHGRVDVQQLECDFLAFSAHKLYGPTGVGFLYGRKALLDAMPPFLGGGEMISHVEWTTSTYAELPHKFEAGTPNIAGVIAFGESLKFIESIGIDAITEHSHAITRYAYDQLARESDITIYGPPAGERAAVVSFSVGHIHPHDISQALDFAGIAIRAGHHCAQPLTRKLGVTATARASFAMYTTEEEINALVKALASVRTMFQRHTG